MYNEERKACTEILRQLWPACLPLINAPARFYLERYQPYLMSTYLDVELKLTVPRGPDSTERVKSAVLDMLKALRDKIDTAIKEIENVR